MICPNCGRDNIPGIDLCEGCGSDLAGLDLPEAHHGFRGQMMTDRVGDLEMADSLYVSPETTVALYGSILTRWDPTFSGLRLSAGNDCRAVE